jgi:hypothetical protein
VKEERFELDINTETARRSLAEDLLAAECRKQENEL